MRPNLKNLNLCPYPIYKGWNFFRCGWKEEHLKRLNDICFADEDLLRLRSLLEKIGNKEGTHVNQTKESFFRALDYFGSLSDSLSL